MLLVVGIVLSPKIVYLFLWSGRCCAIAVLLLFKASSICSKYIKHYYAFSYCLVLSSLSEVKISKF